MLSSIWAGTQHVWGVTVSAMTMFVKEPLQIMWKLGSHQMQILQIFHTLRWQNKEHHLDNLVALSPLRHLLARLLEPIILDDVGKVSQMNQLLHIWRRILLKERGEFVPPRRDHPPATPLPLAWSSVSINSWQQFLEEVLTEDQTVPATGLQQKQDALHYSDMFTQFVLLFKWERHHNFFSNTSFTPTMLFFFWQLTSYQRTLHEQESAFLSFQFNQDSQYSLWFSSKHSITVRSQCLFLCRINGILSLLTSYLVLHIINEKHSPDC